MDAHNRRIQASVTPTPPVSTRWKQTIRFLQPRGTSCHCVGTQVLKNSRLNLVQNSQGYWTLETKKKVSLSPHGHFWLRPSQKWGLVVESWNRKTASIYWLPSFTFQVRLVEKMMNTHDKICQREINRKGKNLRWGMHFSIREELAQGRTVETPSAPELLPSSNNGTSSKRLWGYDPFVRGFKVKKRGGA